MARQLVDLKQVPYVTFSRIDFRTTQEVEVTRCLRKRGTSRCPCGRAADAACVLSSVAGRNKRVKRLAREMGESVRF